MKRIELYSVWCEYDIGLNVSGDKGVYSSEESMLEATAKCTDICGETFQELEAAGLAGWETIEG